MVVAYANVVHMMLMCNNNILIFTFVSGSCIYKNKLHSFICVSWQDVQTHLDDLPLFKTGCIWYTLGNNLKKNNIMFWVTSGVLYNPKPNPNLHHNTLNPNLNLILAPTLPLNFNLHPK